MSDKFDRQGKPLTLMQWATKMEDRAYKRVAFDHVGTGKRKVSVSTVWLGLDHNFSSKGPPVIFETMVFGGVMDQEQERYCTEAEAVAGHKAMLVKVEYAQKQAQVAAKRKAKVKGK